MDGGESDGKTLRLSLRIVAANRHPGQVEYSVALTSFFPLLRQEAGLPELESDRSRRQSCSRGLNFPQTALEESALTVVGDQGERPQVALRRFR